MPPIAARRVPRATYRVQLNREFTFADAEALIPYLAALGIDTLYLAPILLSAPGSTHGYDVNDYRRIDPALGGRGAFEQLAGALRVAGMGLLLDFVPNHMGIEGPFNVWWREVLESGRDALHARFFDIFWDSQADHRIHLPVLEDHYGRVLEAGRLQLQYGAGELGIGYGDHTFPLALRSYALVLEPLTAEPHPPADARGELRAWLSACAALEGRRVPSRRKETIARARRRLELKRRLSDLLSGHPGLAGALDARLRLLNGTAGDARSFDALDTIAEAQHYRLARWQSGSHESSYRRFFTIDSLIGLRMEHLEVFRDSHALVGQLIAEGHVTGLRIDHIDGLWDPQQYLERLQQLAADPHTSGPLFVVVEKILAADERLPPTWPAHGTTGYEFIADVTGVLVNSAAEEQFTELYQSMTGRRRRFEAEARAAKRAILDDALSNTATILANRLTDLIQADRRWRDLSRHELRLALREIIASLHVYRTYRRGSEPMTGLDRSVIEDATTQALRQNPLADPEPFEFVRDVLTGAYPAKDGDASYSAAVARWVLTVQQHTGAVMAKAVEDTAFYRDSRFVALNEVGGDPSIFGRAINAFHQHNAVRLATAPHGLLASSTHDTKMSEDVRARLCVLSEIGDAWETWVREWHTLNRRHHTIVAGRAAPDANEEYRLYQTLVGLWPASGGIDEVFRTRVRDFLIKTANEARVHSTWQHPHADWLQALTAFSNAILTDDAPGGFLSSMAPRARRVAELGMMNTLAQLVLKLTCPGVPDCYQGQELVELAAVDPDNRRAVDYGRRRALLADVEERPWSELVRGWETGGIKMRVMRDLLRFRAAHPRVFDDGDYQPIAVRGTHAGRIIAFSRRAGAEGVVVIVPRLTAALGWPPVGDVWEDTTVEVQGEGVEILTGVRVSWADSFAVAGVLRTMPIAVVQTNDGLSP